MDKSIIIAFTIMVLVGGYQVASQKKNVQKLEIEIIEQKPISLDGKVYRCEQLAW